MRKITIERAVMMIFPDDFDGEWIWIIGVPRVRSDEDAGRRAAKWCSLHTKNFANFILVIVVYHSAAGSRLSL